MANHADIAGAHAELDTDGVGSALRVERQDDDAALALGEPLKARRQPIQIQVGLRVGLRLELEPEAREQLRAPDDSAPAIQDHVSAGSQDERRKAFELANPAGAQAVEGHQQDVLGEVVGRGGIAQVAKAVETDARGQATVELRLGFLVSGDETSRQLGIARVAVGGCQGAISIAPVPFDEEV